MNQTKRFRIGLIICTTAVELIAWNTAALGRGLPAPNQIPSQSQQPVMPSNRTRGLPDQSVCPASSQELIALIPTENPVLTTAQHPTFLFYVPYGSNQVETGEFFLQDSSGKTRLYQTQFRLPEKPGIVSISLPNSPELALEENTAYHWYFRLHCTNNSTDNSTANSTDSSQDSLSASPDDSLNINLTINSSSSLTDDSAATLQVDGWVQRVAMTPTRQLQLAADSPDLWYDSLAQVAAGLLEKPQDNILRAQWRLLLQRINAENLAQEPLTGAVQLEN
jgi:hypothetical protein